MDLNNVSPIIKINGTEFKYKEDDETFQMSVSQFKIILNEKNKIELDNVIKSVTTLDKKIIQAIANDRKFKEIIQNIKDTYPGRGDALAHLFFKKCSAERTANVCKILKQIGETYHDFIVNVATMVAQLFKIGKEFIGDIILNVIQVLLKNKDTLCHVLTNLPWNKLLQLLAQLGGQQSNPGQGDQNLMIPVILDVLNIFAGLINI